MKNDQTVFSFWVYVRKGTAYVQDVGFTTAGFYMGIEPIRIVDINDIALLAQAIQDTITRGNPVIPTPLRHEYKKPAILGLTGTRSWKTFERQSACFTISRENDSDVINESGRGVNGEWDPVASQTHRLPAGSSPREIAEFIVQRVQSRDDLL
jgi:hypothetical protein